jgi:autotransporter passenger strand-loop-strand repeat protein
MTWTIISSGVTSSGLTVSNGKEVFIESGGTTISTTVLAGGSEDPAPGGLVENVTVSSGGYVIGAGDVGGNSEIYGTINGVTLVHSGFTSVYAAVVDVFSGARALDLTVDSGVEVRLSLGGSASHVTVNSGGGVSDGGVATGVTINSSGGLDIAGSAFGVILERGGGEYVISSGFTSGTVVSGGVETVAGVADATVLSSGSYEYDYGVTSGTVVLSGAHEVVASVGTASGSVISNGGRAAVLFGGKIAAPTVLSGGTLVVSEGGKVISGLTIAGGVVLLSGTMAAGQTVSFTGASGILELDNPPGLFQAQISGLNTPGRKIDLGGDTFTNSETLSWSQSGTSGALMVYEGGQAGTVLTLVGTYAGSDFHLTDDGHGGTYVYAQSMTGMAVDGRAAGFLQAAAGFHAPASADISIHAGGTATAAAALVTAAISSR